MYLTCPPCASRFLVDSKAIPPEGRKVRCVKCSHRWHQGPVEEPEPEVAADLELQPADDAPPDAEPTWAGGQIFRTDTESRRPSPRIIGVAVCVAVVAAVLAGLVLLRQPIIDSLSGDSKLMAANVYDRIGLAFDLPGFGLKIENPRSSRRSENGVPVLVIEGRVTNKTERPRSVPRLRAALLDAEDRELQHWFFRTDDEDIPAGESVIYTTTIDNPDDTARKLRITFIETDH